MTSVRRLFLTALCAALLLVPASAAAQERTVSVNGSATQQVPNDTAGLGFSVSKERRSRSAALGAVAGRLREVIAAVQTVPGVGAGDVTTGRISIRKVIRHKDTVLYRASEGISVILHQPDAAGDLVNVAITAGATGTSGPNFFVGNSEVAYNRALVAAFDQARARASALAAEAGATLGPVINVEEGGGVESPASPVAKDSPACSGVVAKRAQASPSVCAGATPPVKPGTSTVTATVHVVFALQ